MRGRFAQVLFVVAILANLLVGLPAQASAMQCPAALALSGHHSEHSPSGHHAMAGQSARAHHLAQPSSADSSHADQVESPHSGCKGGHDAAPMAGRGHCHCLAGLAGVALTDRLEAIIAVGSEPGFGRPPSDQVAESTASLPLLRPPRA